MKKLPDRVVLCLIGLARKPGLEILVDSRPGRSAIGSGLPFARPQKPLILDADNAAQETRLTRDLPKKNAAGHECQRREDERASPVRPAKTGISGARPRLNPGRSWLLALFAAASGHPDDDKAACNGSARAPP